MTNKYLLGVDIGTYSSKGVLVTEDGKIVAMHVVEHGLDMPKPGFFEHDADKVWWHDFVEISRQILDSCGINPNDILAIGTSAIGSCVLPIDKDGNALRPGILYGIDTRASREIEELNHILGEEKIFDSNGSYLTSQASGPKILWIRNNEPEIYAKTRYFLTSEAYLVYKLTDKASIDIYTAGGYSPLFDPIKKEWLRERGKYITPIENLPDIYWPGEIVGNVTRNAASLTGLAEGTPVIAGTTDAAAEAVSAGVSQVGDMMVMFGSSIFFILKTAQLKKTSKFWSSNFVEVDSFAFLGGMSTSGSLTRWFRDQFGQPEINEEKAGGENAYAALAKLATVSAPGANGLIALPYFEGERTPLHDAHACGMFFGLSLKHTRADLYRAILESIAYGIRHNLEEMRQEGVQAHRILAVGGGTRNPAWMQIVSDVAGINMEIPAQQIGASYGDAFMAGIGAGVFTDYRQIHQWIKLDQEIIPDQGNASIYDLNYSIYRDLYDQTANLMHKLR